MFFNKRLTLIIDSAVAGGDKLKLHISCTSLASDWGRTVDFNVFFSYLHVAYDPLITERNYPSSSFSNCNF